MSQEIFLVDRVHGLVSVVLRGQWNHCWVRTCRLLVAVLEVVVDPLSGAEAFPDASRPIGTGASLGCFEVLRGTIAVSLQVSSYLCDSCPRGLLMMLPCGPL